MEVTTAASCAWCGRVCVVQKILLISLITAHCLCSQRVSSVQARAYKFAEWLMQRPEKHIAVVAHSGFLYAFCQNFGDGCSQAVNAALKPHFQNCEMRTIVLADTVGELNPESMQHDSLAFKGGNTVPKPP